MSAQKKWSNVFFAFNYTNLSFFIVIIKTWNTSGKPQKLQLKSNKLMHVFTIFSINKSNISHLFYCSTQLKKGNKFIKWKNILPCSHKSCSSTLKIRNIGNININNNAIFASSQKHHYFFIKFTKQNAESRYQKSIKDYKSFWF